MGDAFQFSAAKSDNQKIWSSSGQLQKGIISIKENFRETNQAETPSFDVPTFSISPEDYNDPYFGLMKIFKSRYKLFLNKPAAIKSRRCDWNCLPKVVLRAFVIPWSEKKLKWRICLLSRLPILKTSEKSTALSAQPKSRARPFSGKFI